MSTTPMLQLIDESGRALEGVETALEPAQMVVMYEDMLRTRLLDERMIKLQRQGRIGFYVPSTGEEAAQIGSGSAWDSKDWVFPSYRAPGVLLMRGVSLTDMIANCFGNEADLCKGRQMPVHYSFRKRGVVSISSPIGTHIIQAVGSAMAQKLRGDEALSVCYFGDGGTSANDFHSGLNFAGVFAARVVFVCVNNQWAISVPLSAQTASATIAVKARAYGIPGVRVDGNDVLAVHQACKAAADRARSGKGPTLVELLTYRRGPHSSSDDPTRYRGDEHQPWEERDPILRFRKYLERQDLWSQEREREAVEHIKAEINDAVRKIEEFPSPPLDTLFSDVYEDVPENLRAQYERLVQQEGTGGEPDPDAAFPL